MTALCSRCFRWHGRAHCDGPPGIQKTNPEHQPKPPSSYQFCFSLRQESELGSTKFGVWPCDQGQAWFNRLGIGVDHVFLWVRPTLDRSRPHLGVFGQNIQTSVQPNSARCRQAISCVCVWGGSEFAEF